MIDTKVNKIKQDLMSMGIIPLREMKGSDYTDPAIFITDLIHIQIGYDYVSVVKESDDLFHFFDCDDDSIESIIAALKKAIESKSTF